MGRNLLLVASLFASGPALLSAEQWLRIGSPNFELYTTAGEKKGKEAILYFEQMRSLFQKLNKSKGGPEKPVRIIAFDSEKGYKPYRINDAAFAYYLGARDRDYIVMRNIASENYPVVIHEYFHLIVEHSGLPLPIWLNEGLAEVYSTLKPFGKQVRMGDIIPGRYQQMLTANKWLSLNTLISVGPDSPHYNEKDKAGMFYSESWALAHMLLLSNEYWKKFPELLAALRPGVSQEAAFQQVYGKSLEQMTVDLERYLRGTRFNGAYFDVKIEKAAEEPDVRPATPAESGLALAELLAVTRKKDEARAAYEKLGRENPKDPQVELAWARISQEPEEIQRHFERAIALGTTDGQVYFDYAMSIREHGASDEQVYALLVKAVELKPDLNQAHYFLGFYASKANRYGEAVVQFLQVKHLEKEQAYSYYRALAYGYYRLGNRKEAATYAEKAVKFAADPKDAEAARELLTYATREPSKPAPPPAIAAAELPGEDRHPRLTRHDEQPAPAKEATLPIEGLLTQVDCLEKSVRLRISVDGAPKTFLIQDPNDVVIKNASADGKHEFTCGPQKSVAVFLEYVRQPNPDYGTKGLVRSIEFR